MWRRWILASRVVVGATHPNRCHGSSKIRRIANNRSWSTWTSSSRLTHNNNDHEDSYLLLGTASALRQDSSIVHRFFGSSSSIILPDDDNTKSTSFSFRDRPEGGGRYGGELPDQLKLLEKQDPAGLSPAELNLRQALRDHRGGAAASADPNNNNNNKTAPVADNKKEASYSRLRDCYVALEYWDYALQTEQEMEDLFYNSDDSSHSDQRAASWYRQGLYWRRLGQLSVTTQLWKGALEFYQQKLVNNPTLPNNEPMLGQVLISLAGVDFGRGNYEAAAQLLARAEPHCIANVTMRVECLQHQGLVYQTIADEQSSQQDQTTMTMALEKYQHAVRLLMQVKKSLKGSDNRILDDTMDLEDLENRLLELQVTVADLLSSMEDQPQKLQDAQDIYESLLESHCTNNTTSTKTNNNTGDESTSVDTLEASLRYKLGRLLANQPNHRTTALEHLQRAVALERRLAHSSSSAGGVSSTLAHSLNVLGAAHAALDQHAPARQCFREALLLAQVLAGHEQANHDPLVLQILHNLDTLQQEHRQQQQQSESGTDRTQSPPRGSLDK